MVVTTYKAEHDADKELEDTAESVIVNYKQWWMIFISERKTKYGSWLPKRTTHIDSDWTMEPGQESDDKPNWCRYGASAAGLRVIAELISPVMTHAPKEIFANWGFWEDINLETLKFADVPAGAKAVAKGTPFSSSWCDEEVDYIKQQMTKTDKERVVQQWKKLLKPSLIRKKPPWIDQKQVRFDAFEKIELKVKGN